MRVRRCFWHIVPVVLEVRARVVLVYDARGRSSTSVSPFAGSLRRPATTSVSWRTITKICSLHYMTGMRTWPFLFIMYLGICFTVTSPPFPSKESLFPEGMVSNYFALMPLRPKESLLLILI